MKHLAAVILATVVMVGAPTQAWAASDPALLKKAEREYKEADTQLNATYKQLLSRLDARQRARLTAAELAWIQFRDKQADFAAGLTDDVYDFKTTRLNNLAELTRERTKALKNAIELFDNY